MPANFGSKVGCDDSSTTAEQICDCLETLGEELCTCFETALEEVVVDVTVSNWDEMPLGIEASLAPVGCITDDGTPEGEVIGKTFLCKNVDEETGAITFSIHAIDFATGVVTEGYTGPTVDCDPSFDDDIVCCAGPSSQSV